MATVQEQYAELIKQSQDASIAAIETWNRTIQQAFGQLPTAAPINPEQVIDQVYDFAGQVLSAQRDFAKQVIATGTAAAEKVRDSVATAAAHQS
ncbi:MAG TPA: hypothetical protein VN847_10365 [Streptosporangiaceae bacterium]|jgi:hypothetical protein|nr:hypothetical protein [Streptosporangiaceae bacterium]